jgi:hypothetical protein
MFGILWGVAKSRGHFGLPHHNTSSICEITDVVDQSVSDFLLEPEMTDTPRAVGSHDEEKTSNRHHQNHDR